MLVHTHRLAAQMRELSVVVGAWSRSVLQQRLAALRDMQSGVVERERRLVAAQGSAARGRWVLCVCVERGREREGEREREEIGG